MQAFIKLRSPHLKEELAPFIFKLNVLNPQFAIDCFFKTGVTLQKLVFLEFLPAISPSIERIALTLSKETLESILILLQDDSLQQRHPEDLARLTFSLLAEYVKQPQPNLFILQNLIESQLPTICYLRREKKIPASARWLPFLHFLSKHLEVAALKIDAQSALLQELCELDAKNVDFSTYLRWATQQPFSEELSMAVASKVEIATLQENTFLTALSFMQSAQQKKLLLKKGIESHLDPELLCSLLVSTFSEHRDFLSQLESLKQIESYFVNT